LKYNNMDFLKMFSRQKTPREEIIAGLFLKESEGSIIFIQVLGGKFKVIAEKKFVYSNGWENIIEDTDQVIYTLETQTKQSPNKAIFFIYSHLVDKKTKEIRHPYIEKVKSLVKNLDFTPLGYIEYHEAVVESIEKKENVPLTAVLIEFDKSSLDIFVYRAGKLVFQEGISRTENLIEDLLPVFEKVRTQIVIPSRIILYDSADIDTEASRLLTHSWKQDFFVQTPKVHVMHEQELTEALLKIFLSQIMSPDQGAEERNPEEKKEMEDNKKEVMGFMVGGDVPQKETNEHPPRSSKKIANPSLSLFTQGVLSRFASFKKGLKLPSSLKNNYLLPLIGLALIIGALFLSEAFFHKAEVIVYLPSKKVDKKIVIPNLNIVTATDSAKFEDEKKTSGKKSIGDKAKGTVTIYNSSLTEGKTFAKGEILTGPNNLKFVLDADVKIASASGDASSVISSTSKGAVTASDIGTESNLSSGTKFTVSGESTSIVIAKNDSAFSGGSRKDVQTVSKQDMEDLKKSIIDKAKDYAKKQIEPKLPKGTHMISQLTLFDVENPDFSHELGEEASEVSIKSQVTITHFDYKDEELSRLISNSFNEEKKAGFKLKQENIHYTIKKIDKKQEGYSLQIEASAKLTQDVDEAALKNSIAGKSTKDLSDVVKKEYKATGIEFTIHDPLPILNGFIPIITKNITLKIEY